MGIVTLALLVTACGPKITSSSKTIQGYIGETVSYEVGYSGGDFTSPQLISECSSLEIVSQDATEDTLTTIFLISDYNVESDCLVFRSNEVTENLTVSVNPQKQAEIVGTEHRDRVTYGQIAKFTVNVKLLQQQGPYHLKLTFSNPNTKLKFQERETSTPASINSGVIDFNTGDFGMDVPVPGYLLMEETEYPDVPLDPVEITLHIEKDGKWYRLDKESMIGIRAYRQ